MILIGGTESMTATVRHLEAVRNYAGRVRIICAFPTACTVTPTLSDFGASVALFKRDADRAFIARDKRARESQRIASRLAPLFRKSQVIGGRSACAPLPRSQI